MNYPNDFINKIINGDCSQILKEIPEDSIDLTITSPPYDNLRDYTGFNFPFELIAAQLYRVTKTGGTVVWIVNDATVNGSETGTSFKQALFFKDLGFNLHDTMIYHRNSPFPGNTRYYQSFEYMFVLVKGKIKTFNPLKQTKSPKSFGKKVDTFAFRQKDGTTKKADGAAQMRLLNANDQKERDRDNVWFYDTGYMLSSTDKIAFEHPATFPELLANDLILSWSNENDIILDPMCGSGTSCKIAYLLKRNFIGMEISLQYCELAQKRIENIQEGRLF